MKSRVLVTAIIVAILGTLVYFQFRTWRDFDWTTFASATRQIDKIDILIAVLLIYFTYMLRAVRWKIFLRPICRPPLKSLVPAQYVGFAGLALLGRPGELVRPYIIAKKTNLTVSSQIAVWTVERIFDIGAFAVLLAFDVFLFGDVLPFPRELEEAGFVLLAMVTIMATGAFLIRRNGPGVANWLESKLGGVSHQLAQSASHKLRAFGEGLNTIHDAGAFGQIAGVSLAIWFTIAMAYRIVLHAYPQPELASIGVPGVLLLVGSSMVGSLIQLPAVGGGSQLAVISMLSSPLWFHVPSELAVSSGILLWLVTFMAVIPAGLIIARSEHVSLRKLSAETQKAEVLSTAESPATLPGI